MRMPSASCLRPLLPLLVAVLPAASSATPPASAAGSSNPPDSSVESKMEITSAAFAAGDRIPRRHTCDGEDVSPPLSWTGVPEGTASFALIMEDPDAPPGTWVHWVLYDLPAGARELDAGMPREESLSSGGRHGACWGVDTFSRVGYYGPCPPPGKPHRYYFRLYALDRKLDLKPRATKSAVLAAMKDHVLAEAVLMGQYGR